MQNDDLNVKKKIMFIKDEDYNYLTYNILIILDFFKSYSENKLFIGYMKLPYLVNFLLSDEDTDLFVAAVNCGDTNKDLFMYEGLFKIYTKSKLMQGHIKRLLFALKKKNIIEIIPDRFNSVGVYMYPNQQVIELLHNEMFKEEYGRIEKIQKTYPRIRSVKHGTFIKKVFVDNGVGKWED